MRCLNPETITGPLSWYKILLLNGFNLIRAKQNPHVRRKKAYENSWSRRKHPKLYFQTTRWNYGKHAKICHGITARQHLIDPRRRASLKEASDAQRKVRQQYCKSQDWMKGGGQILWNAIVICEMSKTSWQRRTHRTKDDLVNHTKDQ